MKNLFRFIQLFGWIQGTFLALKFKFDYLDHFKLPGIQHAFALRKNTSDKATFRQVFIDRYYYMNYPATVNTIIDGGANIGLFTLFIKNKFPAAKVICIEPDAENFSMLQKNTSGYENVFYEHAALWNTKNMLQLHNSEQYNKAGITVSENKNPRGEDETIAGITIDGLLEKYNISRIDIMKLDIEASEKALFSSNFINWMRKTKMIVIELHDWIEPGVSNNFFKAVCAAYKNFSFDYNGESVVIVNNDIE